MTRFQSNMGAVAWQIAQDWIMSFFSALFKDMKIYDFEIEFTQRDPQGVSYVTLTWALGQKEDSGEERLIEYKKKSQERYRKIQKARNKREHEALMKKYNELKAQLDERAREIVEKYRVAMESRLSDLTEEADFGDFEIVDQEVDIYASPPTVTYSVVIK